MSAKIKSIVWALGAKDVTIHHLIKFFEGKDTSKENAVSNKMTTLPLGAAGCCKAVPAALGES